MTMNKVRIFNQGGSSRSDMVATLDKADDLLESLGEHVMTLGNTVDEDLLTGLVADISEIWTPGYGGMSKKEARMAKKEFTEDVVEYDGRSDLYFFVLVLLLLPAIVRTMRVGLGASGEVIKLIVRNSTCSVDTAATRHQQQAAV